jgi:selenocysteine lyase/cysteine desulfurase
VAAISPEAFRSHFPIFQEKVHLASCSQGAASFEALAAIDRFVESWRRGGAPWDLWMEETEQARAAFARLINAQPHEVAVVPNASVGAYMVASALDFGSARNGIVTTDLEFPSIAHVWLAQRRRGAEVRHLRHRDGVVPAEAWPSAVGPATRLVSAFQASYANGARNDLPAIARLAHGHGAYLFVDAYQGAGVMPIDVRALDVDFLVAGALKYLCGTPGIAFLYVREALAPMLEPTLTGWFARANPFGFDPLTLDFAGDARRFQTGTPAIVAAFTANAAMRLLEPVGVDRIWRHVQGLTADLTERLRRAGLPLFSPAGPASRGPQVSVVADEADAVARALAERGFVVAPRGRAIRLSLHYYNTLPDVDRVVGELADLLPRRADPIG